MRWRQLRPFSRFKVLPDHERLEGAFYGLTHRSRPPASRATYETIPKLSIAHWRVRATLRTLEPSRIPNRPQYLARWAS
jgi:hypothetical protein